jgi:hypothetical protein
MDSPLEEFSIDHETERQLFLVSLKRNIIGAEVSCRPAHCVYASSDHTGQGFTVLSEGRDFVCVYTAYGYVFQFYAGSRSLSRAS